MPKGQAVSPRTAALTGRIEDGIERLLRLASLQADDLNQEVEMAAKQKQLEQGDSCTEKESSSKRKKTPINISIESSSSNMSSWYFGLPAHQAAQCRMKVNEKGKIIFTKTPPSYLALPIDVPHPGDSKDPLASVSNSPTCSQEKPAYSASNTSAAISSLPFSVTSQTVTSQSKREDTFLGTFDFPMHIVHNGSSRVCTAKAAVHRQMASPWLLLYVDVVDTDGSKLLALKTELRERETRNVVVNGDSYK